MEKGKSSLSKSDSYESMGEFWDTHDLADFENQTKEAELEVEISKNKTYCAIDKMLLAQLESIAVQRGISLNVLVNLILQEQIKNTPQSTKFKKS